MGPAYVLFRQLLNGHVSVGTIEQKECSGFDRLSSGRSGGLRGEVLGRVGLFDLGADRREWNEEGL